MIAALMMKVLDIGLTIYDYLLKLTGLFCDILGSVSFSLFILCNSEDTETQVNYLSWYDKALKAYAYTVTLPAIWELANDEIQRDPDLQAWFNSWDDYAAVDAYNRKYEPETPDVWEQIQECGEFLVALVPWYITPLKIDMMKDLWKIVDATASVLWNRISNLKDSPQRIIDDFTQHYHSVQYSLLEHHYSDKVYLALRPTFPFDWAVLSAHVKAYMNYYRLIEARLFSESNKPLSKSLKVDVYLDDVHVDAVALGASGKVDWTLTKQMLEKYEPYKVVFECGGVGARED